MDLQGHYRPSREREIFLAAIQKGTTEEQQQILADACGSDLDLRQRIEALLRTKDALGDFLERPGWLVYSSHPGFRNQSVSWMNEP